MAKKQNTLILTHIKNKVFSLALLAFIVIIITLTFFIYANSKTKILQENENLFLDRSFALENIIAKNADITVMLKNIFDLHINSNISAAVLTKYNQAIQQTSHNYLDKNYHLYRLHKKINNVEITNTVFSKGKNSIVNQDYVQLLISILNMQDFQIAAKNNNNSLIASYFMGYTKAGKKFTSIYPPIAINKLMLNFKNLTLFTDNAAKVYDEFAPKKVNSDGHYFWTEPYFDRAGHGMMVSCAIPTYQKNNFLGVIGVDVTLDFLNKFVKKSLEIQGNSYIISPKGYIVAGSHINYQNENELVLFKDFLQQQGGKNKFIIYQNTLNNAPWLFVYLVSKKSLLTQILIDTRYYNLFFLIALLSSLTSYFYIRKNFIKPGILAEEKLVKSNIELNSMKNTLEKSLLELKNAQQKIVESEKLASLGTLVTGIAHEINTPVGVAITANSLIYERSFSFQQLFNENKLTKDKLKSFLTLIQESSMLLESNLERIAELVKDFKAVSASTQEYRLNRFNFKEYLYQFIHAHKNLLTHGEHKIDIKCNVLIIESYKDIFSQILITLIENSILHGFNQRKNGCIEIIMTEQAEHYQLNYSDNGCGIDNIEKSKIFDPFYTSGRGQGKGLGLFAIYNIIKETLHGDINIIDTETKKGICFIITWPKKQNA